VTAPARFNMTRLRLDLAEMAVERNMLKATLEAIAPLLEVPTNRFGKPEYYGAQEAREALRLLAIHYGVAPSDTIAHQAAKVARAALAKVTP